MVEVKVPYYNVVVCGFLEAVAEGFERSLVVGGVGAWAWVIDVIYLERSLVFSRPVPDYNCLCILGMVCDCLGVWVDPFVDVDAYSGEGLWGVCEVEWCVLRVVTCRSKGVPPGLLYS